MLIGGTKRTGERNVYWRNRAADPVTRRKAALSVLQGTAFCHLTFCTAVLMQCHAAQCCLRKRQVLRQARNSPHFLERNVHYHIHNSPPLSQSISCLLIQFNIILPSRPKFPKWSLSLSCPHQNPPSIPTIHTCYMPSLLNYFSFAHPINICCTTYSHMPTAVPADEPCYVTHCTTTHHKATPNSSTVLLYCCCKVTKLSNSTAQI